MDAPAGRCPAEGANSTHQVLVHLTRVGNGAQGPRARDRALL